MKFFFVVLFTFGAAFTGSVATAQSACTMKVYNACYAKEKDKPDSTRGNASASQWCTMEAIMACGITSH